MLKIPSLILTIIFINALQIGFLPGINYHLPLLINLPLLLLVFIIYFYHYETALLAAVFAGLILDFYSPLFFGFFILIFLIEVLAIKFILKSILQHKNLAVLILVNLIAIIIYQIIYLAVFWGSAKSSGFSLAGSLTAQYFIFSSLQMIVHSFIILLFYKISFHFKSQLMSQLIS